MRAMKRAFSFALMVPVGAGLYVLLRELALVERFGALALAASAGTFLHLSLMLAFGTMFPDHQFYIYFIIPVRAKWLALLDAALMIYAAIQGPNPTRFAIAAAMGNYLLFFTPELIDIVRGYGVRARQERRREAFRTGSRRPARSGGPTASAAC